MTEQTLTIEDIGQIFKTKYNRYETTMKEASKDTSGDGVAKYMTDNAESVFKFDDIVKMIFKDNNMAPCGVDAVFFGKSFAMDTVDLIEFKNGKLEEVCPSGSAISKACEAIGEKSLYLEIESRNYKNKTNLEKKALESKLLLENEILGGYSLKQHRIKLQYILVYNEEKNGIAKIQNQLSKKAIKPMVRFGLNRLKKLRYYNNVLTLTSQEFESWLLNDN